mmetsp:Transcript_25051/g.28795  ORF Transcript_25051/g.28795 Transcript_25051/m.28795 type:complete len:213 (+) Transcript_25051:694-1332(+)
MFRNYKTQKIQHPKHMEHERLHFKEAISAGIDFSKSHLHSRFGQGRTLATMKKHGCQTPIELDDMEVYSNPTVYMKKHESENMSKHQEFASTPDELKYIHFKTLERNISDFGRYDRQESGQRSMISDFSGYEIHPSNRATRNKSNIRNNSINQNVFGKYSTTFTDCEERKMKGYSRVKAFTRNKSKTKSYNEPENYSNRVETHDSDMFNQPQ